MTPRFKLSWSLCFALSMSLDGWAFEEGTPSNRETLWQEFMNQGGQHREQRRFADAEKSYLAAVSAAQQFGSEDPRYAASLNALGHNLSPTGPLLRRRDLLSQGPQPLGRGPWNLRVKTSQSVSITWRHSFRTEGSLPRLSRC